jgi:hypothetical protein
VVSIPMMRKFQQAGCMMQLHMDKMNQIRNRHSQLSSLPVASTHTQDLVSVTPLVFTVASNVQSTVFHIVVTVDLRKWDLVLLNSN